MRLAFALPLIAALCLVAPGTTAAAAAPAAPLIDPWPTQMVEWYYNPTGGPLIGLSQAGIESLAESAAASWAVPGVHLVYMGRTTASPTCNPTTGALGAAPLNVVGWGNVQPYGGLTCFDSMPHAQHFNIVMNAGTATDYSTMLATFAHEFGHALGLVHPDTCPAKHVLMCPDGWRYGTVRPTADDLAALNVLYPPRSLQKVVLELIAP